jgi:hypothetical protein
MQTHIRQAFSLLVARARDSYWSRTKFVRCFVKEKLLRNELDYS